MMLFMFKEINNFGFLKNKMLPCYMVNLGAIPTWQPEKVIQLERPPPRCSHLYETRAMAAFFFSFLAVVS